mmetsp:Transcript_45097/g.107211  ORF Transcript_45097/g.107211 Transcript_45097/m.107211 type:complete len:495 (+) Transcript_45097:87-1571(+)
MGTASYDKLPLRDAEVGEASQEADQAPASPSRIYYIDWIRTLTIWLVLFFHSLQVCNAVQMLDSQYDRWYTAYRGTSLEIGIPLLFHISGRAKALAKPKGLCELVVRRGLRLLPPLFVGWAFLVVPCWQYVYLREEIPGAPQSLLPWLQWFFKPQNFQFTMSWLWFLPCLYGVEIFSLPIILFAEQPSVLRVVPIVVLAASAVGILYFGCGFNATFMLATVAGPLLAVCLSTVVRVRQPTDEVPEWRPERWMASQALTVLMMITHVVMICNFGYSTFFKNNGFGVTDANTIIGMKIVPALVMLYGFYLHGYFLQSWRGDAVDVVSASKPKAPRSIGQATSLPLVLAKLWCTVLPCLLVLGISLGTPDGDWETGIFPVYSATYLDGSAPLYGVTHIIGTWSWTTLIVTMLSFCANDEVHPVLHKYLTGSSLVVYIFHYAMIQPFAYWVLRDGGLNEGAWKVVGPFITFAFGLSACLLIYAVLLRVKALGWIFGVH